MANQLAREPVIVEDIATDPLWNDYREVALRHDLRACWSTPIFDTQGLMLGTFAMYEVGVRFAIEDLPQCRRLGIGFIIRLDL